MSEQRLIDANALKRAFEEDGHLSAYIEEYINDAPTIEAVPVVHSHWVNCTGHTFAPVGSRCFCYNCHFYESAQYNWCHGCGAKMDGGGSE